MSPLQLSVYAQVERQFQLEAVRHALQAMQHQRVEPDPPKGINPFRWRAMLKHAARRDTTY